MQYRVNARRNAPVAGLASALLLAAALGAGCGSKTEEGPPATSGSGKTASTSTTGSPVGEAYERGCFAEKKAAICGAHGSDLALGEHAVAKDPVQALRYFEQGCELGDMLSCYGGAKIAGSGKAGPEDEAKATKLYTRGCELGEAAACAEAGMRSSKAGDQATAMKQMMKACDGQNAEGCALAGVWLWKGKGVPKDLAKGNQLMKKGCDLGSTTACDALKK